MRTEKVEMRPVLKYPGSKWKMAEWIISLMTGGGCGMSKKNMRRISILVTAQTAKNLERLASMCGYREIGMVVDKLTREKMISLHTDALMPGERKGKQI